MYFLWAKINIASYGHTMFSLKLLIFMVIRQCIMACFRPKWWWGVGGVGSSTPPGTMLLGLSRTLTCNININIAKECKKKTNYSIASSFSVPFSLYLFNLLFIYLF